MGQVLELQYMMLRRILTIQWVSVRQVSNQQGLVLRECSSCVEWMRMIQPGDGQRHPRQVLCECSSRVQWVTVPHAAPVSAW